MSIVSRMILFVLAGGVLLTALLSGFDRLVGGEPFAAGDLAADFVETLLLVAAMAVSALAVQRIRAVEEDQTRLREDVRAAAASGAQWRLRSRRLLAGLSGAIEAQFDEWGLTEAEADIAGLILKGMSMKEVARARRTTEATIRQQAQGIYRKSGLANRAELSAYFLEDLFDAGLAMVAEPAPQAPPN